ncbi:MAG TPA: hypothetical protein VGF06_00565 [Terriglobales bacterium]
MMMLTYRLVRLVETHADSLASSLLHKVQKSERTEDYRNVPMDELKGRVRDIYLHLGAWLLERGEAEIENRYTQIGARRAYQGVPLSQVVWAIILTKETLWQFILDESANGRATELLGRQELLQLIEQFFERAIYAMTLGYEWAAESHQVSKAKSKKAG